MGMENVVIKYSLMGKDKAIAGMATLDRSTIEAVSGTPG